MRMNRESQSLSEPRSRVIARHVQLALAAGMQMRAYAALVADCYMERTAPYDRIVEFHVGTTADAAEKAVRANAQLVNRFVDGTVKLPADMEEALVLSLPDDTRARCKAALAERYGLLAARRPDSAEATARSTADVMREAGEAIAALCEVAAHGTPAARERARRELIEMQAAGASALEQLRLADIRASAH
jgi:hypothetical protein